MVIAMKSCKDITLLVEKGKIIELSLKEKMQVKFHLAMCKLCRNFAIDSNFLDKILSRLKPSDLKLTPAEKEKIKSSINDEGNSFK
jgi:Zn-finger nucleic acid-binding protein